MSGSYINRRGAVSREVVGAARRRLREVGERIAEEARRRAPVRTGNLARSYRCVAVGDRVRVGSDVPYAPAVERRTHHLRGAVEGIWDEAVGIRQ